MARFTMEEYYVDNNGNHVHGMDLNEHDSDDASLQLQMVDNHRKGIKVRLYDAEKKTYLYPETVLAAYEASLKCLDEPAPTPTELLFGKR